MLGVTKALFCDCSRPVAGLRWRVCLQRGAHAHQEQPFDGAEEDAVRMVELGGRTEQH